MFYGRDKGLHVLWFCRPTCAEPYNSMFCIGMAPGAKDEFLFEPFQIIIWQDVEQLVGWAWNGFLEALLLERFTYECRHVICMTGQTEVKVVGHQRLELNSEKAPFSQHATALLDEIPEVFLQTGLLNDNGFAKQRSLLCPTYIENVCKVS